MLKPLKDRWISALHNPWWWALVALDVGLGLYLWIFLDK